MKKGFSHFSSLNNNHQDSQSNSQVQSQKLPRNNTEHNNVGRSAETQKKQPINTGFSTIKRQASNIPTETDNNISRLAFQNQPFPLNSGMHDGIGSSVMQDNNFSNYPMVNVDNPQFFQANMNSFGNNPYQMLFNQFQSNPGALAANQASSETMIMTLFQIIQSQAKSLQSLFGKVEKMTHKINQFGQKMKDLKKHKKQPAAQQQQPKQIMQHMGQSMENIDSKTLIKILFGSNKVYNYKLELNEPLELPLYRQRNFSISLKLTDLEGKLVKNNNKIPLSLAIYSSENPPKFIEKNTAGQKILKGYIEQSLHFGQCRFQKIQIKEVTSHFRNGWIFIVIIPCMTPLGSANPNDSFIDYLRIQPLVLEKIIVKAKKIKETNKKGKEEKDESQMVEAKDSDYPAVPEKQQSKEKNSSGVNKAKVESNFEQSQDIFEDK